MKSNTSGAGALLQVRRSCGRAGLALADGLFLGLALVLVLGPALRGAWVTGGKARLFELLERVDGVGSQASLSNCGTAPATARKPIWNLSAEVTAVTLSIWPAATTAIGKASSTRPPIR
jgi:hypothetical protein